MFGSLSFIGGVALLIGASIGGGWHPVVVLLMVSVGLGFGLLVLGSLLSNYQVIDWEKGSPYECGFDPGSQAWNPVPMRFFHMVLLFLLWEVETILLIPMMLGSWHSGGGEIGTVLFIGVLLLGLFYEWSEGTLEWC